MKKILLFTALVLVGPTLILGNIARPQPTPGSGIDTEMDIRLDRNAKEARLIIPRSQLKQLRAEIERIDDGDNLAAATSSGEGAARVQTIVSGMFLSFAFIFGGIWLVRSRRTGAQGGKAFVLLALVTAIGSATALVYANAGPPPEARSITGKMLSPFMHDYGFGWGKIKLEVGDEGRRIQLIVPNPRPVATPADEE